MLKKKLIKDEKNQKKQSYGTGVDKLSYISYDENTQELEVHWNTGGQENAICGFVVKAEFVKRIVSTYKAPNIQWDPDYNEAF